MLFGPNVANDEVALSMLAGTIGANYDVANFAVLGYGLAQMLGRLIQVRDRIMPGDAVIFAPYLNDLIRNLVHKRTPCGVYLRANRLSGFTQFPVLDAGTVKPVPLAEACDLYVDYLLLRSVLPFGSLFRWWKTRLLRDRFVEMADEIFTAAESIANARGATFQVIFVASAYECSRRQHVFDPSGLKTVYHTILDQCPTDAKAAARLGFPDDQTHYSPEGHLWAAQALERVLRSLEVIEP